MTNEETFFAALKQIHHATENVFNEEISDSKELLKVIRQIHDTVELATGRQSIVDMDDPHHPHFQSPDWHLQNPSLA